MFEPRVALDGGKYGMEVYRKFVAALPCYLKSGGQVLCEIGNDLQGYRMRNMLESLGLKASIKEDLAGKQRVVVAT